jgi:hypothetical protein
MNKCEYCDMNLHKYKDEFVSVWNIAHIREYYHVKCWDEYRSEKNQK